MVRFDSIEPEAGTLLRSSEVRNNFQALERANELRPVAGAEVDPGEPLKIFVEAGNYATDGQSTKTFTGGFSPDFVAPTVDPRIDVLSISLAGALTIQQGTESASPVAPPYPADSTPIAEVTLPAGVTDLSDPTVTIKDVRRFFASVSGFGINPSEETFTATTSQTVFTLTAFTYAPGNSELRVSVDGVNQYITIDYLETAIDEITFVTPLQSGASVNIWRVGAASAHTLSDLDDVSVAVSEAITDPDGNRTNTADRTNPFATLADATAAGTFGVEHDTVTGEHGPQVNITQSNNSPALIIDKQGIGVGSAVTVNNDGASNALSITSEGGAISVTQVGDFNALAIVQNGDGIGGLVTQNSANYGFAITHNDTDANFAPLLINRLITNATREPMVVLHDTSGPTGTSITHHNNELTLAEEATNTRRFTFNTLTANLTIQNGGANDHLVVTKNTVGTGRSLVVTHTGSEEAANISKTSGSGSALVISSVDDDITIVGAPNSGIIDPLWGGATSNADDFHTHDPVALDIALSDLNNVDGDLETAITGADTPSAANVFATIADLANIKVASYMGNGSGAGQSIAVGFQPDWVAVYNNDDNTASPVLVGRFGASSANGRFFRTSGTPDITLTATGFDVGDASSPLNASGEDYIYIAIKANIT